MKLLQTKAMHIFFNVDPTIFLKRLLNLNSQPTVENTEDNIALESFKLPVKRKQAVLVAVDKEKPNDLRISISKKTCLYFPNCTAKQCLWL
jgi:hypothetical protein